MVEVWSKAKSCADVPFKKKVQENGECVKDWEVDFWSEWIIRSILERNTKKMNEIV
jgi:hypothetical protein